MIKWLICRYCCGSVRDKTMGCWNPVLYIAVAACFFNVSLQGPSQHRLYKDLMANYNPLERPVSNDDKPITVSISINLKQILDVVSLLCSSVLLPPSFAPHLLGSILGPLTHMGLMTTSINSSFTSYYSRPDEKNQVLTTSLMLSLEWKDDYLQWNTSDYPGVTSAIFPESLVWKPDIVLYNSADERPDATVRMNVLIRPDGSCVHVLPGILKSSCSIDMLWFPFDVQRCELKFGSWVYDGSDLNLQLAEDPNYDGDYTTNGEWDLVELTGHRNETMYACCPDTLYHSATFTVVLRRRTLYYVLNLLIPCVLVSIMALLVFLLPADSGEKISLGITVLLSLVVFMLLVAQIMPPTSESVPVISKYFAATMVIVGLSVLTTVLVLQCHHHDPRGARMPKWVQVFLFNWCACFLCMKRPGSNKHSGSSVPGGDTSGLPPQSTNSNMLYEVLLPTDQASSAGKVEPELARILEEVRYIAKRLRDQYEEEALCSEWKFLASVIDRLCLIAFSLVFIFCTIGIRVSGGNL